MDTDAHRQKHPPMQAYINGAKIAYSVNSHGSERHIYK